MKSRVSAVLFAAVLAGCGGGNGANNVSSYQTVSFGDSLSDVGTFNVQGNGMPGAKAFNGGRYTNNPGLSWADRLALYYGKPLTPAAQGGFGMPMLPAGGMGYAQGGALVATPLASLVTGLNPKPITAQVDTFVAEHQKFRDDQLVLLQGGANDILYAAFSLNEGESVGPAVQQAVVTAATQLAAQVGRLTALGATRMVVANVPDLSLTPVGAGDAAAAPVLRQLTQLFNDTLKTAIDQQPRPRHFVLVDSSVWLRNLLGNFQAQGFRYGNTAVACSTDKIEARASALRVPDPKRFVGETGAALLCSNDTLTEEKAGDLYVFADELHPSDRTNILFAQHIERRISEAGF